MKFCFESNFLLICIVLNVGNKVFVFRNINKVRKVLPTIRHRYIMLAESHTFLYNMQTIHQFLECHNITKNLNINKIKLLAIFSLQQSKSYTEP